MKLPKKQTSGFTLIEVLISIILLAIVLTAGMSFYFNASEIMTLAMHKKMAMEMANRALEQIKEAGYDDLPPATGLWVPDASVTFGDFSVQTRRRITDVDFGTPTARKQVELEVSWSEAGKQSPRTVVLLTQMAAL